MWFTCQLEVAYSCSRCWLHLLYISLGNNVCISVCMWALLALVSPHIWKQSIHRFNDLCIDINVDNYLLNVQIQIYAISLTWEKKQQKTDSRLKMENKFAAKFYFHHSVSTGINTAEENTYSYCTADCNYC